MTEDNRTKLNNIFQKVLADPNLAQFIMEKNKGDLSKFQNIAQGQMAMSPYVKYIAYVLNGVSKIVDEKKKEARQKFNSNAISLTELDMSSLYKAALPIINLEDDDN